MVDSFLSTLMWQTSHATTDFRDLDYFKVREIDGLRSPGTKRGDLDIVIDDDGALGEVLPVAHYVIRVVGRIFGATRAEREDNLTLLGDAIEYDGGLGTLIRRLATGSIGGYVEAQARGQFVTGLTPAIKSNTNGLLELQFTQLSGLWSADGGLTYTKR